jgi:hypothetical protein
MSAEATNKMTAEDVRELQDKIIQLCHAAGSVGIAEDRLKRGLLRATYGVDDDTLTKQLKFLKGEGLLDSKEDEMHPSPDLRRWFSTSAGDKHLVRVGLI